MKYEFLDSGLLARLGSIPLEARAPMLGNVAGKPLTDPAFAAVVDRTFAQLAETRRIVQIYNSWFLDRLPTGERLGLLTTGLTNDSGWVDVKESIVARAGDAFVAVLVEHLEA